MVAEGAARQAGTGTLAPDAPGQTDGPRPFRPAGPPQFPRRWLYAIGGAIAVMILVTALIGRITMSGSRAPSDRGLVDHGVAAGAGPSRASQLHAPVRALLDLTNLHGAHAPAIDLVDAASGRPFSLAALDGRAVVVTFANANCADICPVLGAELARTEADLAAGPQRVRVAFVTVNTDPLTTTASHAPILRQPQLASLPAWQFVTGPLRALDRVWTHYGISITAERASGTVSHNDLVYLVAPDGRLAASVQLFANETRSGAYSLTRAVEDRVAAGLAAAVRTVEARP